MKTSTKNTIITSIVALICSIISIVGTKEYIINTANQKQSQEQTQSIVVNINGHEVSYLASDVEELNNKIINLETENVELNKENQKLMLLVRNLQSQVDQKILPDENTESDNSNMDLNSIYVDITDLLFDSNNFNNELSVCKDTYGNTYGNVLIFSNNGSAIFNLNSNFTSLEFTIANSENMISGKKCVIQFFGDEKLIYTSEFIDYYTEAKEVKLNVKNINKLKIKHYYEYDSWCNASAGDAIVADIKINNDIIEQYDNIYTYQNENMLEEIQVFTGTQLISNPLVLDSYGNQYECAYSLSNNMSSELLLNAEYTAFIGKIVPSELMNSEKECQIIFETDTNSKVYDLNYYTEPIDFEINLQGSKFLRIKHIYEYDSWLNSTAGDAMLVNCYFKK